MSDIDYSLTHAYDGDLDLAEKELFQGGFINFGYWDGIDITVPKVSVEDRAKASENLYRQIFKSLDLKNNHKILEIGCGRGYGAAVLADLQEDSEVTGVDIFPAQVEKACEIHKKNQNHNKNLRFAEGKAEEMPFKDGSFDRVYSVEALQHFDSVDDFIKEADRVLLPGGSLSFTTFFATKNVVDPEILSTFPYAKQGVDKFHPIEVVCKKLEQQGFKVTYESIGEYVWYGFDKWLRQTEFSDQWGPWGLLWLPAYKNGLVDYYIVNAVKD